MQRRIEERKGKNSITILEKEMITSSGIKRNKEDPRVIIRVSRKSFHYPLANR